MKRRLGFLAFLLVFFTILGLRTEVTTDLEAALPQGGTLGSGLHDARRFSLLDTVVVELDGSDRPEAELHDAVDQLGIRLEGFSEIASVRYRFGLQDGIHLQELAAPHLAVLLPEAVLKERLSPKGMEQALSLAREKLFSPAGALVSRQLSSDPLDLSGSFNQAAMSGGTPVGVQLRQGHLLSSDGKHALILVRPRDPALGTMPDSPLLSQLQGALDQCPLPTRWLGSHRFAAEAAATIQSEVGVAVTAGVVLLLAVFLLSFRSLRPVLGALPATLLGAATAAAAAGLASPIHGIALAFGGAMGGMAVDYWIHLYLHTVASGPVPATPKQRYQVAVHTLKELLPAYGISVSATALSFAMLATSSYPVVADLAAIGMGSCVGALLSVVVVGPVAFAWVGRPKDRLPTIPLPDKLPLWLALALLALLAGLGMSAANVGFNGDPRALDARLPETAKIERSFNARYGGESTLALHVVEAPTLAEAQELLRPAVALVQTFPGLSVQDPLRWLPAPSQVAERQALLAQPTLEADFLAAAERVGFDGNALLPGFRKSLTGQVAPDLQTWSGSLGAEVLSRTVSVGPDGVALALIIRGISQEAVEHAAHELALMGVPGHFVYPPAVTSAGAEQIRGELLTRSGGALVAVLLFMLLRYRRPAQVLAAALPSLAAAAGTLGSLALLNIPLTPASGPALVLVLGLAFDQGIFMVEADRVSREAFLASRAAILIALATAFAGFAGLTVATHPGVFGVGLVVCLGIFWTAIAAFGVVPSLLAPEGIAWLGRWGRRISFATVGLVQVDALASLLGRVEPVVSPIPLPAYKVEGNSHDRRYGPNRLLRTEGVWSMALRGSPYQIGQAVAALAGEQRLANEVAMRTEFDKHIPSFFGQYLLARGIPLLARSFSDTIPRPYLEEIQGGTDWEDDGFGWVAPPLTRKVCMHALHDVGQALVDSPLMGCTGFVAGGGRSSDGHWWMGRNWDFGGGRIFDEDKAVIYVEREGAIPFVHVAILGLSGVVSGVNEEGIAVTVLAGASDAPIRMATPMIFLVRQILEEARSIDDAVRILDAGKGFVSEGILIADGNRGEAAVLEVTPARVVRLPAGEAMGMANHFRGEEHKNDAANLERMAEGTTVPRLARVEELLAEAPMNLERASLILRDRAAPGGKPLPNGHESSLNADITSHGVIIDATTRSLWVAAWPNVSGPWLHFSLEGMKAGKLEAEPALPADDPVRALRVHEANRLRDEAARLGTTAALERLDHAEALNPGDPLTLIARASRRLEAGMKAEAREDLERALTTPPSRAKERREAEALLERTQ
jgi:predicted exporter